jgi:aspartate/tyrosine/aromatic aminotransferase
MLPFRPPIGDKLKHSPFSDFCSELKLNDNIKGAFNAYIRTEYANRFLIAKEGETIHLVISRLTDEQLRDAWQQFVKEMARYSLTK